MFTEGCKGLLLHTKETDSLSEKAEFCGVHVKPAANERLMLVCNLAFTATTRLASFCALFFQTMPTLTVHSPA